MTRRGSLRGFLAALGVAPQAIPADAEAQAALYRSVLAGKRVLVVLDNARDAAQARPLLPGGSAGCLVVVTSRSQLAGLAAVEGARLLPLGLLAEQEARELLAGRLGAGRVEAEPAAAAELIRLCARLPLALAITAARAAACPEHPLEALAAELRAAGGPLDALDTGDPTASVRSVFSWSYQQLSPAAARLFRLLGIHPGPDITAPATASLADVEPAQARYLLAELARAHLVAEHAPGRYAFHDLLRAYAAEQARALDGDAARRAAVGRALDHYLHTAHAAAVLVNPSHTSLRIAPPEPGVTSEHFVAQRQALAWFEAEHHVLLAAAALAAGTGFERHAWQLPLAIGDYLDAGVHWHELAGVARNGLDAATRLGEIGGQAAAHRVLAGAHAQLARYDLAHAHLADSLEQYRRLGDQAGEAIVHRTVAWVSDLQERYAETLGHCEQALVLFQAVGDQVEQARTLATIGWCHAHFGGHREAREFCQRALALLRERGHRLYEAGIWDNLGYVEHQSGTTSRPWRVTSVRSRCSGSSATATVRQRCSLTSVTQGTRPGKARKRAGPGRRPWPYSTPSTTPTPARSAPGSGRTQSLPWRANRAYTRDLARYERATTDGQDSAVRFPRRTLDGSLGTGRAN